MDKTTKTYTHSEAILLNRTELNKVKQELKIITAKYSKLKKYCETVDFTSPQTEYVETINKKAEENKVKIDRFYKMIEGVDFTSPQTEYV